MGFYQPYFQESKVKMQFNQNPRFGDKHLSIKAWKFILNLIESIHNFSFHTFLAWLSFFLFSSSSSPLFFSFTFFFFFPNETNFGLLKHGFVKALFGPPNKTHFWVRFLYLLSSPITPSIYEYPFLYFILASNLFTLGLLSPSLDNLQFCP